MLQPVLRPLLVPAIRRPLDRSLKPATGSGTAPEPDTQALDFSSAENSQYAAGMQSIGFGVN